MDRYGTDRYGVDQYGAMLDELARQRDELDRVRQALTGLTSRAVSTDRLVSVTVDSRGLATEITIEPAALRRYRAEQLATLLTDLIAEADGALRDRRATLYAAAIAEPSPRLSDLDPRATSSE